MTPVGSSGTVRSGRACRADFSTNMEQQVEQRELGTTGIRVSTVAMGCWPIAGMTSLDVNDEDSRKTLRGAVAAGVNFFDTAYCYGRDGESERLLGELIQECRRDDLVIATKGGLEWSPAGERHFDASPKRLREQCIASLARLNTDYVDLLYLHAPSPNDSLAEAAVTLDQLRREGLTRAVGVSNLSLDQMQQFHAVCRIDAVQPPYNMIVRGIEAAMIPWCQKHQISVVPYWPLMKGLLAGKLPRDFQFKPGDGRAKYPMFQGTEWHKNQDLIDEIRTTAETSGLTVAQLVIRWTLAQTGITSVLCGAKRPYQIEETAMAGGGQLTPSQTAQLATALQNRGTPIEVGAV